MKKHLTLIVSAIAVLWSCASLAQTAQKSGQRFQDGIYARPAKADRATAAVSDSEISDLTARTRGSQVFLKRGAQGDTLFIPENKVATFRWSPSDSIATLSLMDPYYPGPSFSIGWGYPWYAGYYSPWYYSRWGWGGWRTPWLYDSWYSPFFGHSSLYWGSMYYDPWYWGSMAWDPWYWDSWYGPWGIYGMWDWYGPWGMYGPYGCWGVWDHCHYHGYYPGYGGHFGHEYRYTPRSSTMDMGARGGVYRGETTHSTAMRNGLGSTSSVRRTSSPTSRQAVSATTKSINAGSTGTTRRASSPSGPAVRADQPSGSTGSSTVRRSSPAVSAARASSATISGVPSSSGSYSRSSSQSRSTTYERSSSDTYRSSSSSSSISRSSGGGYSGGGYSGGGYSGGGASHGSSSGHRR